MKNGQVKACALEILTYYRLNLLSAVFPHRFIISIFSMDPNDQLNDGGNSGI